MVPDNCLVVKLLVLIVGDSLTSDIQGGISFWIDTCWYNASGAANNVGIKPTYEIRRLTELYELLR
jgi:2-haloacid dehalogenase